MSYKLVVDHWVITVTVGDSHGGNERTEQRYFFSELEMLKAVDKIMDSYYERLQEVAEVRVVEWEDDSDV